VVFIHFPFPHQGELAVMHLRTTVIEGVRLTMVFDDGWLHVRVIDGRFKIFTGTEVPSPGGSPNNESQVATMHGSLAETFPGETEQKRNAIMIRPQRFTELQFAKVSVEIVGERLHCQTCGQVWSPNQLAGGRLPQRYWQCPKGKEPEAEL
jgi:hypothetical protein